MTWAWPTPVPLARGADLAADQGVAGRVAGERVAVARAELDRERHDRGRWLRRVQVDQARRGGRLPAAGGGSGVPR